VTVGGNAPSPTAAPKVLYGTGADQQAQTLAGLFPSKPQPAPRGKGATPGVVDLVVGKNWTVLKSAGAGIPKQQGEIRASDNICKGI
jgi:hypothetical protein